MILLATIAAIALAADLPKTAPAVVIYIDRSAIPIAVAAPVYDRLQDSTNKAVETSLQEKLRDAPGLKIPFRTAGLTVGRLASQQRAKGPVKLHRPFFLVGTDASSIRWLTRNQQALAKLNAVGFVISADSTGAFLVLHNAAKGLDLAPADGTLFVDAYGLTRYPVLVTQTAIEQ